MIKSIFVNNLTVKHSGYIKILVLTFILMLVLEIWMVNRLATYGYKLQELKTAQNSLKLENKVLENLIAQKSSLSFLENRAAALGFTSIKNLEYLKATALTSSR